MVSQENFKNHKASSLAEDKQDLKYLCPPLGHPMGLRDKRESLGDNLPFPLTGLPMLEGAQIRTSGRK